MNRTNTRRSGESDGNGVLAVKGDREKGKGGSKGTGWSKGEWSNPGHTWDSSWHNSHWHGKRTVLRWIRVSLSSSCEEFSEPKTMSRGTHTKTSLSGSPRNFAHVNKFSILAADDNELTGDGCTSTHQGISVNNGNAVPNELIHADAVMNELINALQLLRQTMFQSPRIRHIKAERSSSFVSCSVKRRQQRSPSREWILLEKIERDHGLGSAEYVVPENIVKSVPLMETEASRQGQTYHTADGCVIKNKGEKTVTMYSETGDQYRARYQITDVTRPLNSVCRDQGNNVLFTQTGGWIISHETGRYTWFRWEHEVYVLHSWINESPTEKRVRWPDEPFTVP